MSLHTKIEELAEQLDTGIYQSDIDPFGTYHSKQDKDTAVKLRQILKEEEKKA